MARKTIEGYVLDTVTAQGIDTVPVTLYDATTDSPVVGTDAYGLSSNPVNTDGTGHFQFTMNLSPGPVYVDAAIPGGTHDRRYGLEQMQVGDHWMSDIGTLLRAYTDGVLAGTLGEMAVTVSGSINQYTVATGDALIQGYAWTLESGSFSAAINANSTQANRHSIVVLRQYIGGPHIGKQKIDIIYGTSSGVDPAPNQGGTVGSDVIWEFPLWKLNTALNASVSTLLLDMRAYTSLGMTISDGTTPVVGSVRNLEFSANSYIITSPGPGIGLVTPSFGTGAGDFKEGNAESDGVRFGYVQNNTAITSIGNVAEIELMHVDVALDPTATYDAVITGSATIWSVSDSLVEGYLRTSLDIPFNSPTPSTGGLHYRGDNAAAGTKEANATPVFEWTKRGISGVSTIRAYLMLKTTNSSSASMGQWLSAKFYSRL